MAEYFGIIEAVGVFAIVLAFVTYEIVKTDRELKKSRGEDATDATTEKSASE